MSRALGVHRNSIDKDLLSASCALLIHSWIFEGEKKEEKKQAHMRVV